MTTPSLLQSHIRAAEACFGTLDGPYLVLLSKSLQVVQEHVLLRQQGEGDSQPVQKQQKGFGQGSLVWPSKTQHISQPNYTGFLQRSADVAETGSIGGGDNFHQNQDLNYFINSTCWA